MRGEGNKQQFVWIRKNKLNKQNHIKLYTLSDKMGTFSVFQALLLLSPGCLAQFIKLPGEQH